MATPRASLSCRDLGDLPGARAVLERALAVCEQVLGASQLSTVIVNNLDSPARKIGVPENQRCQEFKTWSAGQAPDRPSCDARAPPPNDGAVKGDGLA